MSRFALFAAAFVLCALPAQAADKATSELAAPAIRVVSVTEREIVETLAVTGTILPREEAVVGIDLAGLLVLELRADIGDRVEKGDLLAVLDKTALEIQQAQLAASRAQAEASVAQAAAQVSDAEIAVRQALEAWERAKALKAKGVASAAQYDNAVNAHDSAKAKLNTANMAKASANAQIAVIDVQIRDVAQKLAKTEVRAPAAGLILSRSATLGGLVSASSGPLFRMAAGGVFELEADIAEQQLAMMKSGMPVTVILPGEGKPLSGAIRLVAPEIDRKTRLGKVRISLDGAVSARSGGFARASIEIARIKGLAVPQAAIVWRGKQALVQRVREGVVESVEVETGLRDKDFVAVSGPVLAGEEIVSKAGPLSPMVTASPPCATTRPEPCGHELEFFRLVHPQPDAAGAAVHCADGAWRHELHEAACYPVSEYRHPDCRRHGGRSGRCPQRA